MLDTVSGRLKYQYIKRDATSNFSNAGVSPNDPNYLNPYTSAFDMQSNTTNLLKLYLDWTPIQAVGGLVRGHVGPGRLRRRDLRPHERQTPGLLPTGNWNASDKVKLNAFGSWEQIKYPSDHRYIGTVAGGPSPPSGFCTAANPNCYDPFAAPYQQSPGSTTASYNWSSGTQGRDVDARRRRRLASHGEAPAVGVLSVRQQQGRGDASATRTASSSTTRRYCRSTISITARSSGSTSRVSWAYNKNWSFTGGYSYGKSSHNDIATDGYQYVVPYPGWRPTPA